MTRNRKLLIGGVALAALGLATAGAIARHGGHGGWGHHGGGHQSGHWRGRGFVRAFCHGNSAEKVDHILVRIKHKADVTDAQMPAYQDLATTVRAAAAKMKQSCPPKSARHMRDDDDKDTSANAEPRQRPSPIERLERAETMLEAGLEAVKTVRPAAETFYATLSDTQKANVAKMRKRKCWGRGRGHWREHRRGHQKRGSGDGAPKSAE